MPLPKKNNRVIVTSALPYANGHLHIGHLLEHVQTDIWVRLLRANNIACHYVCASDAHGTPIMLRAKELKTEPEKMVEEFRSSHIKDLESFNISHDNFYTTHSEENKYYSELIYIKAKESGFIESKEIEQLFDESAGLFLSDRYVKGTCPKCSAEDQYGDNCEVCGAKYEAAELINPVSTISGQKPVIKTSEHVFFKLSKLDTNVANWMKATPLQEAVKNKLEEWFQQGLKDWDISRDSPYFGFEIPDMPGKYFYVWLDAPIGYIASLENYLKSNNKESAEEIWSETADTEIYHFIGKDIMNFHALFWPALLETSKFKKPTNVFVHGFLGLNGAKMSKSKGNFLSMRDYLDILDADYIRYYLASKLSPSIDDIDLNYDDFQKKVNSDLVGKFVNIASRSAGFLKKNNNLIGNIIDSEFYENFISSKDEITNLFADLEYSKAIKEIMKLADLANAYVDDKKPWILAKDEKNKEEVIKIASTTINLFRVINTYLKIVIPATCSKGESFLKEKTSSIDDIDAPLTNHKLDTFSPILNRLEDEKLEALIQRGSNG
jgi:methionyl-tRNA synthetase|tara:strand:+ start:3541 stop:5193 length:1653 start_codon:yes stop_codon:yes gene_type:complete